MLGVILIDKPIGISSHDAVNSLRRTFHTKRIGHAGTLDPLATGLLVVAIGPATRFLQYLPLEPKRYLATIQFGRSTSTYDAEGEITETNEIPLDLSNQLASAMESFKGLIEQTPPMFSAIKVDGRPLYELARKGITVPRQSRKVYISNLHTTKLAGDVAHLEIECSGGTYIRSLAHDLGQKIRCGAHLRALRRTDVGRFSVNDSCSLTEANSNHIIPLRSALDPLPEVQLDEFQAKLACDGMPLIHPQPGSTNNSKVKLIGPSETFLGIARADETSLFPECVLPKETIGTFSTCQ